VKTNTKWVLNPVRMMQKHTVAAEITMILSETAL